MNKIITKPSATFKGWMTTYLSHSQMDHFLTKHPQVYNVEQVKTDIITLTCDVQHIRNTIRLSAKKNQRWHDVIKQKTVLINALTDVLDKALIDDLIVNDGRSKPRVMTNDDLMNLRAEFIQHLMTKLPTSHKINWILKHKTVSDKTLGRKINLRSDEISNYKSGKRKIGKMKLENAVECAKYYDIVIQRQLMKA